MKVLSVQALFVLAIILQVVFAGHRPYSRSQKHNDNNDSSLSDTRDNVDIEANNGLQNIWRQKTPSSNIYSQQQMYYGKNVIRRVAPQLTQQSPMAANILGMTKDNFQRFPLNEGIKALTEVCHAAISTETLAPNYVPEQNEINMYLLTENKNITIPLRDVSQLWNSQEFDSNKGVVIYITSWQSNESNEQNDALNVLSRAFNCRGQDNFVVFDIGRFVKNYHAFQTLDTEMIGKWLAQALLQMKQNSKIQVNNRVHLIGHGVGAHIAGSAGRRYAQATGELLPRITGLDPAMLCHKNYDKVVELRKGDAKFVDIIHSNSYGLGIPYPTGDVDFYTNSRKSSTPGCTNVMCAHEMAVRYFAETVLPGFENDFITVRTPAESQSESFLSSTLDNEYQSTSSLGRRSIVSGLSRNHNINENEYDFESRLQQEQMRVPMGYNTPFSAKGVYYTQTNPQFPYGKNAQSTKAPQCMKQSLISSSSVYNPMY